MLRRLCDRGIFRNADSVVTSLVSRERFYSPKGRKFAEDAFGGSLPRFLTAFIRGGRLDAEQAREIQELIDTYEEGEERP